MVTIEVPVEVAVVVVIVKVDVAVAPEGVTEGGTNAQVAPVGRPAVQPRGCSSESVQGGDGNCRKVSCRGAGYHCLSQRGCCDVEVCRNGFQADRLHDPIPVGDRRGCPQLPVVDVIRCSALSPFGLVRLSRLKPVPGPVTRLVTVAAPTTSSTGFSVVHDPLSARVPVPELPVPGQAAW